MRGHLSSRRRRRCPVRPSSLFGPSLFRLQHGFMIYIIIYHKMKYFKVFFMSISLILNIQTLILMSVKYFWLSFVQLMKMSHIFRTYWEEGGGGGG